MAKLWILRSFVSVVHSIVTTRRQQQLYWINPRSQVKDLLRWQMLQAADGVVRLAAPTTHEEFARVLYSALRAADERGLEQCCNSTTCR
jgi:hypothetical protein